MSDDSIVMEDRIDESGIEMFHNMGFENRLPDRLVKTYNDYKRIKDRIHPGRISPEMGAALVMIAGVEGKLLGRDVKSQSDKKPEPVKGKDKTPDEKTPDKPTSPEPKPEPEKVQGGVPEEGSVVEVLLESGVFDGEFIGQDPDDQDAVLVKLDGDNRPSRSVPAKTVTLVS